MSKETAALVISGAFSLALAALPYVFPALPWYLLFSIAILLLAVSGIIYFRRRNSPPVGGSGGTGGSAKVGGNGKAIGGPGGSGGTYGIGGAGGNAVVEGDGVAVGGAGGHAGVDGVWRPPAPSGYVIHQRSLGLKPDPELSQFGRGGTDPEYYEMLKEVRRIEVELGAPYDLSTDANQDLLERVNERLTADGRKWRARVDASGHDYEFYVA